MSCLLGVASPTLFDDESHLESHDQHDHGKRDSDHDVGGVRRQPEHPHHGNESHGGQHGALAEADGRHVHGAHERQKEDCHRDESSSDIHGHSFLLGKVGEVRTRILLNGSTVFIIAQALLLVNVVIVRLIQVLLYSRYMIVLYINIMNPVNTPIANQLAFRSEPKTQSQYEHAVLILKPGFTDVYKNMVEEYLASNSLQIVNVQNLAMNTDQVFAIYNDIFRYSHGDTKYGVGWKQRKLDYMISGESLIYTISGDNAQALCENLKYKMRDTFGKMSVPNRELTDIEFEKLAIKNIIHVVDEPETEVALWLFSPRD